MCPVAAAALIRPSFLCPSSFHVVQLLLEDATAWRRATKEPGSDNVRDPSSFLLHAASSARAASSAEQLPR